jgi:hypothetical protein
MQQSRTGTCATNRKEARMDVYIEFYEGETLEDKEVRLRRKSKYIYIEKDGKTLKFDVSNVKKLVIDGKEIYNGGY